MGERLAESHLFCCCLLASGGCHFSQNVINNSVVQPKPKPKAEPSLPRLHFASRGQGQSPPGHMQFGVIVSRSMKIVCCTWTFLVLDCLCVCRRHGE